MVRRNHVSGQTGVTGSNPVLTTNKNKYEDTVAPAMEWCREYFGKSGSRWFEQDKKFYFKDEKDLTMFILRYS